MSEKSHVRQALAGVDGPYQTHRPVLREAVLRVPDGIILELGAGDGSTPGLHEISKAGRIVITVEHDSAWFERFAHLRSDTHHLVRVASWSELEVPVLRALTYGVAFVDHAPAERRVVDIAWLAQCARAVVVHDTECAIYGYEKIYDLFRYKTTYKVHSPWTSVLSNFVDVSTWTFDSF